MSRRSLRWRAFTVVLALGTGRGLASCAADGEVTGGTLTEAGVIATTPPVFEASDPAIPRLIERACGTNAWDGLYRDVFGPKGEASCVLGGSCHGSPEATGAASGGGLKCFSPEGCCASVFYERLVSSKDRGRFEDSALYDILRREENAAVPGKMPKLPNSYVFSRDVLARIADWVRLTADPEADSGPEAGPDGANDGGGTDAAPDTGS